MGLVIDIDEDVKIHRMVRLYTVMYIYLYLYICACAGVCVYMYMYVYVYVCVCVHFLRRGLAPGGHNSIVGPTVRCL